MNLLKETSDYYNRHWSQYATLDYPKTKIDQAANFFSQVIHKFPPSPKVLDVGCGDGVHWNYLRKIAKLEMQYTGIDISKECIDFLSKITTNQQDTFLQMDAGRLDFDDGCMDIVFAYGVIGYAEVPRNLLMEMVRVCKTGGMIGIFSPEINGLYRSILYLIRRISQLIGTSGRQVFANLLVPFFGLVPSESGINLRNATWQQVREVILTDIAPPHLTILSNQTLLEWFSQTGVLTLSNDAINRSMIWGKKTD